MTQPRVSVVILAGGQAKRMKYLCEDLPKSMTEFFETPFLELLVRRFLVCDWVSDVSLAIGHMGTHVTQHFLTQNFPQNLKYSFEHIELGTGGALRQSANNLDSDIVLVVNGDTIVDFFQQIPSALEKFIASDCGALGIYSSDPGLPNSGAILLDDDERVVASLETINYFEHPSKPIARCVTSTGCYLLNKSLIKEASSRLKISLEAELLPEYIRRQLLQGFVLEPKSFVWDFGTPERLGELLKYQRKIREIYLID